MYRSSSANASASPPLTPSHRAAAPPPGAGAGTSSLAWSLSLPAASSSLLAARSNAKLLGVALVVSGDFGTRTVFRHPIPPAARNKKNDDSSHANQSSAVGGSSTNGINQLHPSSSSGVGLDTLGASPPSPAMAPKHGGGEESDNERDSSTNGAGAGGNNNGAGDQQTGKTTTAVHATGEEMYGMSPDDFARLFCTKSSLCARVLDVSVDALRFVSFPIRLRFQDSRTRLAKQRRAREKMRARERMKANLKANQASKRKQKEDEKQSSSHGDEFGVASGDASSAADADDKKNGSEEKNDTARESGREAQVEDGDADEQTDEFDANNGVGNGGDDDNDLDDNNDDEDDDDDDGEGDLSFESDDDEEGEDGESAPLGSSEHDLTFFNVVFILNGAVSQTLASMYGNVAALLARALLHEQTRAHFVSQQAQLMVSIRDKYLNAVARADGARLPLQRTGRPNLHVDLHVLSRLLLQHSLLANHLHQLYYGLLQQEYERFGMGSTISSFQAIQDDLSAAQVQMNSRSNLATVEGVAAVNAAFAKLGSTLAGSSQGSHASSAAARSAAQKLLQLDHSHTHLLINGWFQLHFSLTPSLLHPMYNPHSAPTQPLPLVLKPYQTLLLTVPVKNLLASLPADCNPLLRTLVSQANPLHSFARLSQNLRIPFNHFSQLVSHLLYWNKGVLIDAISSENCYVLNEKVASMAATPGASTGRARSNQVNASSAARRSISARAGMSSFSPSIASSNGSSSSTTAGSSSSAAAAAAAAAQQQLKMRRRSSSVDAAPPLPLPSFLPAALLYEWCTMFPQAGVGGLLAFLTRISNPQARSRTLGQHLQRLTVTANQAAASANSTGNNANTTTTVSGSGSAGSTSERGGSASSSSAGSGVGGGVSSGVSSVVGAGSTVSTTASATTASLAHRLRSKLHADFIAQLVFLLQKRWIVQQQHWLIRLEDEDTADEDEESEEEEEDEDGDGRGYAGRISASSSARSLRSMYNSGSSNDLTRQNSAASKEDNQQETAGGNLTPSVVTQDDPWFALLERLTPLYFDGKHSMTEILWSERDTGLTLQHLQHLLKLYPSQLISVMHP